MDEAKTCLAGYCLLSGYRDRIINNHMEQARDSLFFESSGSCQSAIVPAYTYEADFTKGSQEKQHSRASPVILIVKTKNKK